MPFLWDDWTIVISLVCQSCILSITESGLTVIYQVACIATAILLVIGMYTSAIQRE